MSHTGVSGSRANDRLRAPRDVSCNLTVSLAEGWAKRLLTRFTSITESVRLENSRQILPRKLSEGSKCASRVKWYVASQSSCFQGWATPAPPTY